MRSQPVMPRTRSVLAVVPAVLLACGDRGSHTTTPPVPHDATDAGATTVDGGTPPPVATATTPARPAPHTSSIVGVALDRTGTAAASIDAIGSVRLWRALDGSAPPLALPLRGARALEVAIDADGFTVGAIDGSSAAHLYHVDRAGGLLGVDDVPAVPQALGLVALDDGAWLLARADQSLALTDRTGTIVDELVRDGTRIEALRPVGAHDALAIVSREGDRGREFVAVAIGTGGGHLAWQRELPLAIAPLAPVEAAVAPDGKHLAYFATPEAVKAAQAPAQPPAGGKAASGPGLPHARERRADEAAPRMINPTPPARAVVIDLATGADVTPRALAAQLLPGAQRIGFTGADALGAYSLGAGDWLSGLGADADLVASALGRNCPPAIGGGRVIAGVGQSLAVDDPAGATRFLGYQYASTTGGALSPDGATAAWITGTGELLIAPATGGAAQVVQLDDPAQSIDFVDAHTVVATTARGQLALVDATRGAVLEQVAAPTASSRTVTVAPGGRWLAGVREGGGVWVMRVDLAATPRLGTPRILADCAFSLWLLDAADPAAPALITVDGNAIARTYTGAQLATGVPVNKLGTVTRTPLGSVPSLIDGAGRPYEFDGRDLIRYESLAKQTPTRLLHLDNLHLVTRVPGTDGVLVADSNGTVRAVAADGTLRWSTSLGNPLSRLATSADGSRAVLVAVTGTRVVDLATGDDLTLACGWQFGAWPTPPAIVNLGVPSLCE